VLDTLHEKPIVSVKDVQGLLRTTFAGATPIMQRLVDAKILGEITRQARHRRVQYKANVRLFDDAAGRRSQKS
jgi:hypothetical protein